MKIILLKTRKPIFATLLFCCLLCLSSCVSLVAPYNAQVNEKIQILSKSVDKFYLNMLETTSADNNGRAYPAFAKQYVDTEVELNSLLAMNKVRPLNKNSTRICEITLQFWVKYKEAHKKANMISDANIILNRIYLRDLFYDMQVASEASRYLNPSCSKSAEKVK